MLWAEVLVHVDGDDVLPVDFMAKHLEALRVETPFVFGLAQCFGVSRKLWLVLPWQEHFLWDANQCNTALSDGGRLGVAQIGALALSRPIFEQRGNPTVSIDASSC
jgi:hypothetical protein